MEFPDWSSAFPQGKRSLKTRPRHDSHIIRIKEFLRTMKSSQQLTSYLSAISLAWCDSCDESISRELIDLVGPSIKHLHLKPSTPISMDMMPLCLTSLELNTKVLGLKYPSRSGSNWRYSPPTWRVDRELFYSFFCLPNLRSLSVEGIRGWDWFEGDALDFSNKTHTSNITCLKFPYSAPAGRDLSEVLSWPKSLLSYHHESCLDDDRMYSCRREWVFMFDVEAFVQTLSSQQASLEEIFISSANDDGAQTFPNLIDLSSFSRLRRVGLMVDHLDWPTLYQDEESPTLPISIRLPSGLEELQIELTEEDRFQDYFDRDHQWAKHCSTWHEVGELGEWLCQIAQSKIKYPNLRKVTIWRDKNAPDVATWIDMRPYRNYHLVEEAFRVANIAIEWVHSRAPPMFSA
ncbi:hypothetical protein GLAREA_04164 [Glarea lozoyensis ATCC 20868]|uniref:F-box domain-containing protein n=1 Tax=Glarea lozoyensis (strain ATCC 20868 / MF5171) TaxID=1116229 RepID=S3CXY5_GLAL2|nr:uncharacterized protein GLAREA_04164 [Glarea lozoyensis ATCC 20868]EPE31197.1 hypothetical protein GLAREA_04164 [Glarea lozoyensis ATCC 20868]